MNDREFLILRNLLTSLAEAGDYPTTSRHLQADVAMATRQLTTAEFDLALATTDTRRLVTSVASDRGTKYAITDAGRVWLQNNRI